MRQTPASARSLRWIAVIALCGAVPVAAQAQTPDPPKLDQGRLTYIYAVFAAGNSKFEWGRLAKDAEEVLPYVENILADPESGTRALDRAFIFANKYLTKYDCKTLVEPTVAHLKHHNWEIKAEAMMLLREIGRREDCPAVTVLLDAESHYNHIGAAMTLEKLGGRRELIALDLWLNQRAADAKGDRNAKDTFEYVTKARDALRERLEKEEKVKPVEPTDADKVVAKFADADAKVRAAAVESLRKVGSRADSTAVVALLHDPDAKVRTVAAEWLGAVGGKRELIALEIRLREPRATGDAAFDAVAKAKRAVAERVEADEKKLKAKAPDVKPDKK